MALYSLSRSDYRPWQKYQKNQDGSVSEKAASRRSTSVAAAAYRAGTPGGYSPV